MVDDDIEYEEDCEDSEEGSIVAPIGKVGACEETLVQISVGCALRSDKGKRTNRIHVVLVGFACQCN